MKGNHPATDSTVIWPPIPRASGHPLLQSGSQRATSLYVRHTERSPSVALQVRRDYRKPHKSIMTPSGLRRQHRGTNCLRPDSKNATSQTLPSLAESRPAAHRDLHQGDAGDFNIARRAGLTNPDSMQFRAGARLKTAWDIAPAARVTNLQSWNGGECGRRHPSCAAAAR